MKAYSTPNYGERLDQGKADALANAVPGIMIYADPIAKALFPDGVFDDPDAGFITDATMDRLRARKGRWPGIRDALYETHPVASTLREKLGAHPEAIPQPEPAIVTSLEALGCVRIDTIVYCRGVPIPAGADQVRYFVVLRYRPLFSPLADPARIYRGDLAYDAAHTTDEMQESILLVSTQIHRDNLAHLATSAPELYLAIWMRELEKAEALAKTLPTTTFPAGYQRSEIRDPHQRLLIGCDIMGEYERGFELAHELRFIGGVTRGSIKTALKRSSSMTGVYAIDDNTHRHIAAGAAHMRSMHPTMNDGSPRATGDIVFEQTKHAFLQSPLYHNMFRKIRLVLSGWPTRCFLGVEPARLLPVMLIHMHENLVRHERQYWLGERRKDNHCEDKLGTRSMSLAIVIMSNICHPTACAMMNDSGNLPAGIWIAQKVMPLIQNPKMREELAKEAGRQDKRQLHDASVTKAAIPSSASGDGDAFKSAYGKACYLARLCSKPIGQPGWTQGFRFDAWRQPSAEVEFLSECCEYVRFAPARLTRRQEWDKFTGRHLTRSGRPVTSADVATGLPKQQLVERIQDLFRPQFDRLQSAQIADSSTPSIDRQAILREIALALPALSAITDDPALHERFWIDQKSVEIKIAREGAWDS